ncbi:hypothetical protein [Phycicoccus avicenniae]|uniref:hypothetical protein n=1 Tax=Phycicoccus avicenniae TaxID=2828860 RepID=UPI003D292945
MARSTVLRSPVRLLLAAAFVAVSWLLLGPAQAHAEEPAPRSGGLLGQLARTLDTDVLAPVSRTTTAATGTVTTTVERTVDRGTSIVSGTTAALSRTTTEVVPVAPVAPAVQAAAGTVDDVVAVTTRTTRSTVSTTTSVVTDTLNSSSVMVSDTVIDIADTTDTALGHLIATVDDVLTPVTDVLAPVTDVLVPTPGHVLPPTVSGPDAGAVGPTGATTADAVPALAAVGGAFVPPAAGSSGDVARTLTTPVSPTRVLVPAAAAPVLHRLLDTPAPLGALTALVCLGAAGALTISGPGGAPGAAALTARHPLPPLGRPAPVLGTARTVGPRPVLLPGLSPD